MNNDVDVKKREWVKNAAIVFLIIMVILTFFSNTIMNRSLPEVAAQYTQSSTITSRIRGSGTVTADEMFEVTTKQAYTVSEVRVRNGDEVEAGDVLVVLSGGDSEETLEVMKQELAQAEHDLSIMLLDSPSSLASLHHAVQNARFELTSAQENRNTAQNLRNQAQDRRNQAQNTHNQAKAELGAIDYDAQKYNDAKSQEVAAQAVVDKAALELEIAQDKLDTFDKKYGPADTWPPETADDLEEERGDLLKARNEKLDNHTKAKNDYTTVLIKTDFNTHKAKKDSWDLANQAVIAANNTLADANNDLDAANKNLTTANQNVTRAQQSIDAANEALSEAQRNANIEGLESDFDILKKNNEITALQEKIEELQSGGSLSEVTAAVSGIVRSVDISPGQQTVPDKPLMVIERVDMGYTLLVPVTASQSAKVNIGDSAEVDRGYWSWGDELYAVLTGMRPNPENAAGGRLLVFSVTGDNVENGSTLNITMNQRSENYSIVVPNSAVREDTNGTFVLIIETRSSPMRNRYIAKRVDVDIIATDDTSSAISAAGLTGWDFVITTSTRPIEPGMEVRLTDNP